MPSFCRKLLPICCGGLQRGRRDLQHGVDDLDRVAGDEGAGHHRQRDVPLRGTAVGRDLARAGRGGRTRRGRIPAIPRRRRAGRGRLRNGRRRIRRRRPLTGGVELVLGGLALGGQPVDLGLLVAERLLRLGQRRDRRLLAGFGVGDGLVGLLLGQPGRGLLVDLLGAGPLQVGHHLLGADGQGLTGRRGGDDVLGIGRHHQRRRRSVDVGRRGEDVESLLGVGDGGVGIVDRLRAGVDLLTARRRPRPARSARRPVPC